MSWAFLEMGVGDPLVIFHGIFGDKNNWKNIASKLTQRYRVFLLDLPGHGETPTPKDWSNSALAVDFWSWADEQSLTNVHLLGHSWGAKVAWEAALKRPDRVSSLITGDIGPGWTPLDIPHVGGHLINAGALDRDGAKAYLQKFFPVTLAGFFLKSYRGGARPWVFDIHSIVANSNIIRAALEPGRMYCGPSLQIWGDKSTYPTQEAQTLSNEYLFQPQSIKISNAGHWFHADNGPETFEVIQTFLDRLDQSTQ